MKKYPMLNTLLQLFLAITVGLLEKICTLIYLLLPMGVFMLLMSFRSKNHKASAISAFTNERSEFQHIFPNFILVIVEPDIAKKYITKKADKINKFWNKYQGLITLLSLSIGVLVLIFLIIYFIF